MLDQFFIPLLIALLFIIAGLSYSIYKMVQSQKKLIQEEMEKEQAQKKKEVERVEFVDESIRIIAKGMLEEQCEISEGCLRIRNLIERTPTLVAKEVSYVPFYTMYEEIKKFKTHEERKALTKQERFNEDKERYEIEERYRDDILRASRRLLDVLESESV